MELVGTTEAMTEAGAGRPQAGKAGSAQIVWRKSTWSTYNGNCVEVADLGGGQIGVRDTRDNGAGQVLVFGAAAWRSFLDEVKGASARRT